MSTPAAASPPFFEQVRDFLLGHPDRPEPEPDAQLDPDPQPEPDPEPGPVLP